MLKLIKYNMATLCFWVAFFALMRITMLAVNHGEAATLTLYECLQAMSYGLVFDCSIWAYGAVVTCLLVIIMERQWGTLPYKISNVILIILAIVLAVLMPANAMLYQFWHRHFDATDVAMALSGTDAIFASTSFLFFAVYLLITGSITFLTIKLFNKLTNWAAIKPNKKMSIVEYILLLPLVALLIIPIRGGIGIAPLNTGRAYFSQKLFANHTALNTAWNFLYSTKRLGATAKSYRFMSDEEARQIFETISRNNKTSDFKQIIKNEKRPNIIVILLESFSAHTISYLGGENITPCLNSLLKESVAFSNIYAASDRSGKGLVATMCGYPVLPTYSIIQYPQKTQNLPFIARYLRQNGYDNQTFIYGGDLGFNNFNSLVTLAGFDKIITEEQFDSDQMGDKWGAHDQYTFDRLLTECQNAKQPFHNFLFTLSSHEPFTVPMKRKYDYDYFNSIAYTDSCLGDFICKAKEQEWWDNTIVVLLADHGHAGAINADNTQKSRFNIPLIFTGGALAVKDTIVTTIGSQIDLATTLLPQIGIETNEFVFGKNLLSPNVTPYAFYDFNDGYGYVDTLRYQVYDNAGKVFLRNDWYGEGTVEIKEGQAILQTMQKDCNSR